MRFSTKIAITRIKWKHEALKLHVHSPYLHKAITSMVIVLVLTSLVGGTLFITNISQGTNNLENIHNDLIIQSYSLNGEVTGKITDGFSVKINTVKSLDDENRISQENKNILVTDNTKIIKVLISNGQVSMTEGQISDITDGQILAIYTSANPLTTFRLTAERVELIEQL